MTTADRRALDDPVGESLRTRHAHLARTNGNALGYTDSVATFVAVPVLPGAQDWADLAQLLGPRGFADMFSSPVTPPPDWEPAFTMAGVQLVADTIRPVSSEPSPAELGSEDVADMLELADITRPGPFWSRTIDMGTYLGIRHEGRLVAMAGERLRPPGWTEISGVCTLPKVRGQGLATQLVRNLATRILQRGERPFLHVGADNAPAIALYEQIGFRTHRPVTFRGFRTPDAQDRPTRSKGRG